MSGGMDLTSLKCCHISNEKKTTQDAHCRSYDRGRVNCASCTCAAPSNAIGQPSTQSNRHIARTLLGHAFFRPFLFCFCFSLFFFSASRVGVFFLFLGCLSRRGVFFIFLGLFFLLVVLFALVDLESLRSRMYLWLWVYCGDIQRSMRLSFSLIFHPCAYACQPWPLRLRASSLGPCDERSPTT